MTDPTPCLPAVGITERRRDRHLARWFNVFRYLNQDELGLSLIIADLLDAIAERGLGASFRHEDTPPNEDGRSAIKGQSVGGGPITDFYVDGLLRIAAHAIPPINEVETTERAASAASGCAPLPRAVDVTKRERRNSKASGRTCGDCSATGAAGDSIGRRYLP